MWFHQTWYYFTELAKSGLSVDFTNFEGVDSLDYLFHVSIVEN